MQSINWSWAQELFNFQLQAITLVTMLQISPTHVFFQACLSYNMLRGGMSLPVRPGEEAFDQITLGKGSTSVFWVSSLITEVFSRDNSSFPLYERGLASFFNF